MIQVHLKSNIRKRIEKGHPWVYDNEIARYEPGEPEPGQLAEVFNPKGKYIGTGYCNPKSQIRVRILTRHRHELIDEKFFRNRIQRAWQYRQKYADPQSCRLIYGEADGLPGLIVDKFNDYLSVQMLTYGIDQYRDLIIRLLDEEIKPAGIYERNDAPVRGLEGLPEQKGFLKGPFDPVTIIRENGVKMKVDIENGQKTGYFLDQRENRLAITPYVKDAEVLDCFCHTAGFAMHAAVYGAKKVTAVDISEQALETARENARLNGVEDRVEFVCENAFDLLKNQQMEGKQYDVVILDPPAFTKSARKIEAAVRGYKDINLRGMKLVKPGGILVTASCSHYMYPELFREMLHDAARDARKTIRELDYRTQAKDHPILWNYEESHYLKFFVLSVE